MVGSTYVLGLLALICFLLFRYWRPPRKMWAAGQLIPGPKPLPLIGNGFIFLAEARDIFSKLLKIRAGLGSIVRVWIGPRLLTVLADPDDIKTAYCNPRITNRMYTVSLALRPFFGNSLFTSADEAFRVRKKMMTPMFHFKKIDSFLEIFGEKANILVEKLDKVAGGKSFDINKKMCLCSLDALCETVVGVPSNTQESGNSDFQDLHQTISRLVLHRAVFPWQLIPWVYPLTIDGRKAKSVIKTLHEFYGKIIARKLAAYRQGDRSGGVKTGSGKIAPSILDMLIEASETQGSILTEKNLEDEVALTTAAGLLTVGHTMSNLLLLIAIHPQWQDVLFAEMSDVFADDMNRPATHEDIAKMPVLDRVLRETLRLFPVVGVLPRQITEDIALPSGYTLPRPSSAVILTYFVHRDPNNFPEPDKFLPNRWLPGSGSTEHTHAYIPFGAGARRCIGQKFCLLQMKSTISQVVRRFKMTTDSTMKDLERIEMEPLLKLHSEVYQIRLEKRDGVLP